MAKYAARRFLWMILVLFLISVVTFLLMRSVPGGPFAREKRLPESTIALLNKKYNLDAPLVQQYVEYIGDIVIPRITYGKIKPNTAENYLMNTPLPQIFGDEATLRWANFGPTYKSRSRSVNDIFRENLPISFQLGMAALLIALVVGMPLGVVSALKRNTVYDYLGMGTALLGVSFPVIITAPVLQYLFGVQLKGPPCKWLGGYSKHDYARFCIRLCQRCYHCPSHPR